MEKSELNQIIDKSAQLAWTYEQQYGGCAQVVLAAIKETLGNIGDDVFLSATGLAGGVGRTGHSCGALTGGVMALSCFWGRPYNDFPDLERRRARTLTMSKKLTEKFQEVYGGFDCCDIQKKIMGRAYNLADTEEFRLFIEAGGHDDKCPSVCANAVRWLIEILNEEKLI